MRKTLPFILAAAILAAAFSTVSHGVRAEELGDGVYAELETSMGTMVLKLDHSRAPRTVANFVGLAEGTKEWTDPKTGEQQQGRPFYDGLIFH
ncbi:peptidylprolyl isomerase, partial [Planctomycetota bacterium]